MCYGRQRRTGRTENKSNHGKTTHGRPVRLSLRGGKYHHACLWIASREPFSKFENCRRSTRKIQLLQGVFWFSCEVLPSSCAWTGSSTPKYHCVLLCKVISMLAIRDDNLSSSADSIQFWCWQEQEDQGCLTCLTTSSAVLPVWSCPSYKTIQVLPGRKEENKSNRFSMSSTRGAERATLCHLDHYSRLNTHAGSLGSILCTTGCTTT